MRFTSSPIIVSLLIIITTSIFSFHAFSYYQSPETTPDPNPTINLIFPDQTYQISYRDLATTEKELIIPTKDSVSPQFHYNDELGLIESILSPQDYVVDLDQIRSLVEVKKLANEHISLAPPYSLKDQSANLIASYNQQLSNIYRSPLNISLKDGSDFVDLTIEPSILRKLINPTTYQSNIPPELVKQNFLNFVTSNLTAKQKKYFNPEVAYQNARNALNYRFMGAETPLVLGVDDGPTSNGEKAEKYLEADLSQQKMYFFIGGSLYKEYKISTGIDYPTPVGEYHILNKAPKAYSSIYDAWMPYWMGFTYAKEVGAYLGLHEIAYAIDAKGKPIYRHGYYIGDMMTGGCIAMEPKDSREIYNLSDVGMLIRVVK